MQIFLFCCDLVLYFTQYDVCLPVCMGRLCDQIERVKEQNSILKVEKMPLFF